MIAGHGIDIIEISRIKESIQRFGENFLKRVFTDNELSYARTKKIPYQHLAARFAAKEAFAKAFGHLDGIKWKDVELANSNNGKPLFKLSPRAEILKKKNKIDEILVSISHTRHYAVASVLLVAQDGKR